jgi:hypothetical protein
MQSIAVSSDDLDFGRAEIERSASLPEIVERVGALIRRVMEQDRSARAQRGNFPVERAKAFIAEHLCEPFRLEDIAESIMLSPAYLSSLFKKETGENLSDYIQRSGLKRPRDCSGAPTDHPGNCLPHRLHRREVLFQTLFPDDRRQAPGLPEDVRVVTRMGKDCERRRPFGVLFGGIALAVAAPGFLSRTSSGCPPIRR